MNNLDKQYLELLQDILDNGTQKEDRTGTGTISVFGREIRHKMSEGFPLLTTKKMAWKQIVTELLWFLRGETNIQSLVKQGNYIWVGDAYKHYESIECNPPHDHSLNKKEFIEKIKTDDEFAKKWGDLGPVYGQLWRDWDRDTGETIDQIQNLIDTLKTNPDSRRMMVSAWNPTYIRHAVLPPCHDRFQVYTRELSDKERYKIWFNKNYETGMEYDDTKLPDFDNSYYERTPKRAISLMWNQRSVDVPLGLPFNIASYGLLLLMLADEVMMYPDELIGNLGDTHIYQNQIEGVKEQLGRELTMEERFKIWFDEKKPNRDVVDYWDDKLDEDGKRDYLDEVGIPTRTREPFELPIVYVRDGIWSNMDGDIVLENYKSHGKIDFPLSN